MPLYSFFIITATTEVLINVTIKVIIYLGLLCSAAAVVFFSLARKFHGDFWLEPEALET